MAARRGRVKYRCQCSAEAGKSKKKILGFDFFGKNLILLFQKNDPSASAVHDVLFCTLTIKPIPTLKRFKLVLGIYTARHSLTNRKITTKNDFGAFVDVFNLRETHNDVMIKVTLCKNRDLQAVANQLAMNNQLVRVECDTQKDCPKTFSLL